ncbi:MAG TPA: alpha/beta hydrolase [Steroidobacteraceae bacterium]|nr:alpha/beta hydrolase [Steroidobacteraceae bacterium]
MRSTGSTPSGIIRVQLGMIVASIALMSCASSGPVRNEIAGSPCTAQPRFECPDAKNCDAAARTFLGASTETKTGRKFFLDYACDLKPGEKVAFILNLHGAGSIGNWQRSYFPAVDLKEKYRLVVATPTALTDQPTRRWMPEADDEYLHGIVDKVISEFGRDNIETFWLAGHSQGGMTSRRIVCTDYFKDKVDGFLSLSGGRVGAAPSASPNPALIPTSALTCDFSHIFAMGELEASSATATDTSEWASKYGCTKRVRKADVVDDKRGYVTATDQSRGPSWGTTARPGTAQVYEFDGCKDDRVVVDVVRINKGHTEGLEPKITEEVVKYMLSAKGGKLQGQ